MGHESFESTKRTVEGSLAAPMLAASIFLDVLDVFLFFLNISSRRD